MSAATEGLRVLVVDDYADTAMSLAQLVSLWGHEAHVAMTGEDALGLARTHGPDVVLLDLMLPGLSGWELAGLLRKMPGMEGAFLVAISGFGREEDKERSRLAGCDLHLLKPVSLELIRTLLEARHKEKNGDRGAVGPPVERVGDGSGVG
jgi:two-component system CheB/CheR fusion protein